MAGGSSGRTLIVVALISLVGTLGAALISNWPESVTPRTPSPKPPQIPTEPKGTPVPGASPDMAADAMNWIKSRCGQAIHLVAPSGAGSGTDISARLFAKALVNSGNQPVPVVSNRPGVFRDKGRFSYEKFHTSQLVRGMQEGCLLVIVPDYVRDRFARPRFNVTRDNRSYSIVLPDGIVPSVRRKWNLVFAKADKDPDFVREIRMLGLQAELIAME